MKRRDVALPGVETGREVWIVKHALIVLCVLGLVAAGAARSQDVELEIGRVTTGSTTWPSRATPVPVCRCPTTWKPDRRRRTDSVTAICTPAGTGWPRSRRR